MEEIAHYTDFASLIANDTIDKQKVAKHFSRAAESYDAAAVVQHDMAQRLLSLLPENFDALHILEIGCGTGLFTKLLAQRFTTAHFTINDLCPTMCDIATQAITNHTTCMAGDAEQIDFHGTYGLITSAAAIQWFSNLPDFLSRIEASLANDGIILFSTFGSDNLKELRHTTGKGLPYFSSEVLHEIFERYYTDVSVVEERHTLMFDSPIEVLRHMQQTGANGLTGTHFSLRRFSEQYQALYTAENGSVSLTYHPIYIIARKNTTYERSILHYRHRHQHRQKLCHRMACPRVDATQRESNHTKLIQTGNDTISEDIALHRRIMNVAQLFPEDWEQLTYPIIYTYPASPHLAAEIDHYTTDMSVATRATQVLASRYDVVLLEGAGGPMVPLTRDLLTIDYVAEQGYPVILVTSGRLGSINHTLLCIESIVRRGLQLHSIIYNRYPSTDTIIENDTIDYLRNFLANNYRDTLFFEMPEITIADKKSPNFIT